LATGKCSPRKMLAAHPAKKSISESVMEPSPRRSGKLPVRNLDGSGEGARERIRQERERTSDRSDLYKATQLGLALAADSLLAR